MDPDLSAWSKAIANGRALAAVLGNDAFRDGAKRVFVTGSFWFSAVPMAAAVATIGARREENAIEKMHRQGEALRDGILDQARSWDLAVNYTGPPVQEDPCLAQPPNPADPRPRPRQTSPKRRRSSKGPATSRSCGGRSGSSPCSRLPSRSSRSPPASS